MPEGAALRLDVTGEGNARTMGVFAGDSEIRLAGWSLDAEEVRDVLDEVRETLKQIHSVAGMSLDLTAQRSAEAVDKLLYFARGVGYGLFGERLGDLYEQAELRAPGAFDPSVPARIVEVTAPPDFSYPFELLTWRDPENLPQEQRQDPALRARALLGMAAIVRRRFDSKQEEGEEQGEGEGEGEGRARIENEETLPVTVFRNPSLTGAKKEVDYFTDIKGLVKVYGPWPQEGALAKSAAARHLMNSCIDLDGKPRQPVAVLHLACHCSTTGEAANLHYLNVGGEYGKVLLGDLKKELTDPQVAEAPVPRPLVFLNACGTAVPQMADRSSFTKFLLRKKFLGVLGTLCDISDTVAAHFAMVFYEALLSGKTVGEAMHEARWHLMDRHRNPLGLLYTFYGNVDLKVSRPRTGGIVPACEAPAPTRPRT